MAFLPPVDGTNFDSIGNYGINTQDLLTDSCCMDGLGGIFGKDGMLGGLSGLGDLMGGLSALASAWQGMQQLELAEDMFGFQQDAFNRNLANQAQAYNTNLADRQAGRLAGTGSGGGMYESLDSYVANNRLDDTPV